MGNHTAKVRQLDDHDHYHCPPETIMIMKPSMNPNMASNAVKVSIFDSESCTMYDIRAPIKM